MTHYFIVLRLGAQEQHGAAGSLLWVSQGWAEDVGRAAFFMEVQGMKRSQARSDWQSQCRAAVGFEIPISLLTLGWGLFSTSRGWLHSFAGGLLPPSSKLAIYQVPEDWILLTTCATSASSPLEHFGYGKGHISNNSDYMDLLPFSFYTWPLNHLQSVSGSPPKGMSHVLMRWILTLQSSAAFKGSCDCIGST